MIWNFIAAIFVAVALSILSYAIAPKPRTGGGTGDPRREFREPTSETGRPIPVVFGTATVESPNVLHFDHKDAEPTGHRANYYMSLHYGICQGPIDRIRRVRFDRKTALSEVPTSAAHLRRSLRITDFWGGNEKDGGISGWYTWQNGSLSQRITDSMAYVYGDLVDDLPAYRGIATIMFSGDFTNGYRGFWWGRQPRVPPADFMVERIPNHWYPQKASIAIPAGAPTGYTDELTGLGTDFGPDCNPAHIIHECLVNDVWGASMSLSDIDDDSFRAAADTFHAESLGLSIVWDVQETLESFLQSVMDQVEAVLYLDVYDGRFKLRPLRGGYSLDSLPSFDTDTAEIISVARSLPAEIPNDIALKWTNPGSEKTELIKRQNIVGVQRAGAVISDNRNFYGIRNVITASRIADREVAAATEKMLVGEAKLDRTGWEMRPGDVFKLTSDDHQLSGNVVRAVNIDYGAPGDDRIRVNFVEDIFARTAPNFEQLGQGGTPSSPRRFNLTAEDGGVLLDWIEPRDDGGSPILFYQFQQDGGAWQAASGLATQHRVTGLVNGQTYTFRVRAVNAVGPGAPSIQLSIGPDDTPLMVPGVPRDFQGITFGSEAEIRWAEPTSDGGATIIRYEYDLDESDVWIAIPESSRFIHRILNLELERTYRIRLRAVNSVGAGDATWPLDLVTRDLTLPGYARPPKAEGLTAIGGIGVVLLTWDNPFAHYQNHARTIVYRAEVDDFTESEQIGISAGISYVDEIPAELLGEDETTFYYWIAWQSNFGIIGNASDSASATVAEDPAAAIRRVSQLVLDDPLTKELLSPLGALDDDSTIDTTGLLIAIEEIEAIRAEKLSGQRAAEQLVRDYTNFLGRAVAQVDQTANANASAVTTLIARVTEEAGRIDALATQVTSLQTELTTLDGTVRATSRAVDGLSSRVTATENSITAVAASVTRLDARLTDAEGNITTQASAQQLLEVRVTQAENLEGGTTLSALARWTVKTTVNGRTGGVGLYNDGTTTRFLVNADRFAIISPNTNLDSNAVVPFVVDGNRVYIDSAVIRDASISALKASNAFLTNLTAVHGTLAFARIDRGNVFDLTVENRIQSDNFSATAGWRISRDGTAIFDAASIRGKLTADQIDADVRNYDVLFSNAAGHRAGQGGTAIPLTADVRGYNAIELLVSDRASEPTWIPFYVNVGNLGTSQTSASPLIDPVGGDNSIRIWRDSTGRSLFNAGNVSNYRLYVHAVFGIRRLGSGTTGGPTSPPTSSTSVTANAGVDRSVASAGSVTLGGADTVANGSGSTVISWSRISGTGGFLSSTTAASPTFTAPTVTSGTRTIVWRKTVTNNGVTDTDDVTVTVTAAVLQVPGTPGRPSLGSRTATSITVSIAPVTGATSYRWRYSTNNVVSNADPSIVTSGTVATISGLQAGTDYWIDVIAVNSAGDGPDSADLATSTTDAAPVATTVSANAGSNRSGTARGGTYTIGGSDTITNPQGSTVRSWTRISGSSAIFISGSSTGSFVTVGSTAGTAAVTATFRKTVTNNGVTDTDDVTVTFSGTAAATTVSANAGSDVTRSSAGTVTLGGFDTITNPQGSTTYSWQRISGTATIVGSSTGRTILVSATQGTTDRVSVFRKTTTNNGVSDTDDVRVTVTGSGTPPPPTSSLSVSITGPSGTQTSQGDLSRHRATVTGGAGQSYSLEWQVQSPGSFGWTSPSPGYDPNTGTLDADGSTAINGPTMYYARFRSPSNFMSQIRARLTVGSQTVTSNILSITWNFPPPPPPPSCITADTLVWMADGSKKAIRDVHVGDAVLGRDQANTVRYLEHGPATDAPLWRINGATVTGDHSILTRHGWATIDERAVSEGDLYKAFDGDGNAVWITGPSHPVGVLDRTGDIATGQKGWSAVTVDPAASDGLDFHSLVVDGDGTFIVGDGVVVSGWVAGFTVVEKE